MKKNINNNNELNVNIINIKQNKNINNNNELNGNINLNKNKSLKLFIYIYYINDNYNNNKIDYCSNNITIRYLEFLKKLVYKNANNITAEKIIKTTAFFIDSQFSIF